MRRLTGVFSHPLSVREEMDFRVERPDDKTYEIQPVRSSVKKRTEGERKLAFRSRDHFP